MKKSKVPRSHQWVFLLLAFFIAAVSVGCDHNGSDGMNSGGNINPLAAYQQNGNETETSASPSVIDGNVTNPGAITQPIITVSDSGTSIDGHSNAPLLDNMHPGWQQASCFDCHNSTSKNPEHNYTSVSLCKQCHGENGLPGLADTTPPVISGITPSAQSNAVKVSWKTNEECVSTFILKTSEGDKFDFPASQDYTTSHSIEISGLQPSTNYYYEIVCSDKCKNKTSSASIYSNAYFTTLAETVAPSTGSSSDTDTDTDTETEVQQSFLTNVSCEPEGIGNVRFTFTVQEPVNAFFYIFKEDVKRVTSQNISNGFLVKRSDDFPAGVNGYTLQNLANNTTYRYWMYVTKASDSSKKYEISRSMKTVKTNKF